MFYVVQKRGQVNVTTYICSECGYEFNQYAGEVKVDLQRLKCPVCKVEKEDCE